MYEYGGHKFAKNGGELYHIIETVDGWMSVEGDPVANDGHAFYSYIKLENMDSIYAVKVWVEYDTGFEDLLESEVQAFLFYIKKRWERHEMFVKEKEHRMWFNPTRLVNDDLVNMMSGTESNFEASLIDFLHDMFKDTGRTKLYFDTQYIWENVPDAKRKDQTYIRNVLKDMPGVKRMAESSKYAMPFRVTQVMSQVNDGQEEGEVMWPTKKKQCRPYEFDARFFLTQDEYDKLAANRKPALDSQDVRDADTDTQTAIPY